MPSLLHGVTRVYMFVDKTIASIVVVVVNHSRAQRRRRGFRDVRAGGARPAALARMARVTAGRSSG